jgi:hypothetical protein
LLHVFVLSNEEISVDEIEPTGGGDEWMAGCDSIPLPHATMDGLWESLIFDSNAKCNLLDYAQSALFFSSQPQCILPRAAIHWNCILLLNGGHGVMTNGLFLPASSSISRFPVMVRQPRIW